MGRRRAAIYGGTFDPVHHGHLDVARRVHELFELDEVIFVPACVPPHKRGAGISSAFHRYAMLALATAEEAYCRISTLELDEPNRPYAVDTVARFREILGSTRRLFYLIGADSWAEIEAWYQWERLLKMCDLIVVTRPGYPLTERGAATVDLRGRSREEIAVLLDDYQTPRVFFTDETNVDISATAIRAQVRSHNEAELRKSLPQAVADYVLKYKLYQDQE